MRIMTIGSIWADEVGDMDGSQGGGIRSLR